MELQFNKFITKSKLDIKITYKEACDALLEVFQLIQYKDPSRLKINNLIIVTHKGFYSVFKSMLDGIKWTNKLKHKLGYGEYIYIK